MTPKFVPGNIYSPTTSFQCKLLTIYHNQGVAVLYCNMFKGLLSNISSVSYKFAIFGTNKTRVLFYAISKDWTYHENPGSGCL